MLVKKSVLNYLIVAVAVAVGYLLGAYLHIDGPRSKSEKMGREISSQKKTIREVPLSEIKLKGNSSVSQKEKSEIMPDEKKNALQGFDVLKQVAGMPTDDLGAKKSEKRFLDSAREAGMPEWQVEEMAAAMEGQLSEEETERIAEAEQIEKERFIESAREAGMADGVE